MIIEKIPFQIDFPLKILKNQKVNFKDKEERKKIFQRHIYYYKYGKIRNTILEKRSYIFFNLAGKVVKFLNKENPSLSILGVSVFGSSLYLNRPGDFDFLVITKGNVFSHIKTKFILEIDGKISKYSVEISIKGIENFSKGVFDTKSDFPIKSQRPIIYRTAISLFRRHMPILGYDFVINRNIF